ncbi:MAG: helix-turn-helix transcriptional regulator [Clostridia bacterium]|nr:helix-turn-helix transcriptional regulator [Clostridia bacterium]
MENLEKVFSKNLIKYRTLMGLKQSELAKKINYSDKSISKWERGEGLPDLKATKSLCDIFGITVDDMLKENDDHKKKITKTIIIKNKKHFITSLLSASIVWLIATVVYVSLLISQVQGNIWLPFIYAIPLSSIVFIVFSSIWGNNLLQFLCISLLLWGTILSITLSTPITNIWFICVIGAVCQTMVGMWFALIRLKKKRKS